MKLATVNSAIIIPILNQIADRQLDSIGDEVEKFLTEKLTSFNHENKKIETHCLRVFRESLLLFGIHTVAFDTVTGVFVFITIAGQPHLDSVASVDSCYYWTEHNRYFALSLDIGEVNNPISVHHCIWLLTESKPLSWTDLALLNSFDRESIMVVYAKQVVYDLQFLGGLTNGRIVTGFALGYSQGQKYESAQSAYLIHAHNLLVPDEKVKQKALSNMQEPDSSVCIKEYNNEFLEAMISFFAKPFMLEIITREFDTANIATISKSTDIKSLHRRLEYFIDIDGDSTSPGTVLTCLSSFYAAVFPLWNSYVQELDLLDKEFPENPSFNIIIYWNETYSAVQSISIAPSLRGPGERLHETVVGYPTQVIRS